jgi:serine/threonine-protein kinase HipA
MWQISKDSRIEALVVFVDLDGQPVPVGQLIFEGTKRQQSRFVYARSWLERTDKFPLAPSGLALKRKAIPSAPYAVSLLFQDAAPDGWGRGVLTQAFPNQVFGMGEFLAAAGDNRTGYLRFGATAKSGPSQWKPDGEAKLELADGAEELEALMKAAEAADDGQPTTTQLELLFRSSADVGGARPKARIMRKGKPFIAKFRAWGDAFDDPRMEAVCLSLACDAGIEVPEHEVVEVAGRGALLVRRFDRSVEGFRIGYMSAATLMGQHPTEYRSESSYAELAVKAREAGITPCESELFRRLLFNTFIHNTDDHLRNHAFVRMSGRWRLSPVFDLVPCRQPNMVLRPARGHNPAPDPFKALAAHAAFGLEKREAQTVFDEVATAMAKLPEFLDLHRVAEADRKTVAEIMTFAFNPPRLADAGKA